MMATVQNPTNVNRNMWQSLSPLHGRPLAPRTPLNPVQQGTTPTNNPVQQVTTPRNPHSGNFRRHSSTGVSNRTPLGELPIRRTEYTPPQPQTNNFYNIQPSPRQLTNTNQPTREGDDNSDKENQSPFTSPRTEPPPIQPARRASTSSNRTPNGLSSHARTSAWNTAQRPWYGYEANLSQSINTRRRSTSLENVLTAASIATRSAESVTATSSAARCKHLVVDDDGGPAFVDYQPIMESCCMIFVYDWMTDLLAKGKIGTAVVVDLDCSHEDISPTYFGCHNRTFINIEHLETDTKQIIVAGHGRIEKVEELLFAQRNPVALVVSRYFASLSSNEMRFVGLAETLPTVKYSALFCTMSTDSTEKDFSGRLKTIMGGYDDIFEGSISGRSNRVDTITTTTATVINQDSQLKSGSSSNSNPESPALGPDTDNDSSAEPDSIITKANKTTRKRRKRNQSKKKKPKDRSIETKTSLRNCDRIRIEKSEENCNKLIEFVLKLFDDGRSHVKVAEIFRDEKFELKRGIDTIRKTLDEYCQKEGSKMVKVKIGNESFYKLADRS